MIAVAARPGSMTLARSLLWLTVAWNLAEGVIAVSSGLIAGSVALVGFGLDSFIEVAAAGILLWRIGVPHDDPRVEGREMLARRVVGATLLILAAYVVSESFFMLVAGSEPEVSPVGTGLAIASLAIMPVLSLIKLGNARRLQSPALVAESTETLICSYLSLTLFIGLVANALMGWGWADVAAALAMVPWIAKEGIEGIRGGTCEDD